MRKLILAMQMTLDGSVEGPNGEIDWIVFNDEEQWKKLFGVLSSADTFLLGGRMYSGYADYWRAVLANPSAYSNHDVEYARFAEKTQHYVFSSTMEKADWNNTKLIKRDTREEILKIKEQTGKNIIVLGGAAFASSLINLELIDEYWLRINQAILAGGKKLFNNIDKKINLKLLGAETYKSGVVELHYTNS
jgi:dihydrofolate reductase